MSIDSTFADVTAVCGNMEAFLLTFSVFIAILIVPCLLVTIFFSRRKAKALARAFIFLGVLDMAVAPLCAVATWRIRSQPVETSGVVTEVGRGKGSVVALDAVDPATGTHFEVKISTLALNARVGDNVPLIFERGNEKNIRPDNIAALSYAKPVWIELIGAGFLLLWLGARKFGRGQS